MKRIQNYFPFDRNTLPPGAIPEEGHVWHLKQNADPCICYVDLPNYTFQDIRFIGLLMHADIHIELKITILDWGNYVFPDPNETSMVPEMRKSANTITPMKKEFKTIDSTRQYLLDFSKHVVLPIWFHNGY